jgi:S1-C subfamily serine protease
LAEDGLPLMVKRKDGWCPARLLSRNGDRYKIRYVGEGKGEEVVEEQRVRHLFAGKPGEAFPLNASVRQGPFLGIRGEESDGKFTVKEVVEGSSAAEAGLQAGDVILSFGGKKIRSDSELTTAIRERKIGEKVIVEVHRGKKTMKLEVKLGQQTLN